ncbi:MAG: DUF4034 domain-containing protein [Burkholderiaceae bacterium]|jgi:hypothetical protein|nr:DUF4034 domain-containing protein [Burkholderiaceae bacterium]
MKTSNLIKTAIAGVTLCLVAAGNVQAEQCPLVATLNSHATTLKQFKSWQLFGDAKFSQLEVLLEKRYLEGLHSEGGDVLMSRDLNNIIIMNGGNQDLDKLVHMWLDQYPQSFFAQLSAGIFYIQQAAAARGTRAISETSQDQLDRMSQLDAKAIAHLQKAMQLNPRSALPYSNMIDIAGVEGQAAGKDVQEWLQLADQVDPKNLSARMQAINYLSPRWGGSFESMEQAVQQAQKSLSIESIHYLEFFVMIQKASHEEVITQDAAKAYALYKQAQAMCENAISAREGIIRTYQPGDDNNQSQNDNHQSASDANQSKD